jgi:hypothetical protein
MNNSLLNHKITLYYLNVKYCLLAVIASRFNGMNDKTNLNFQKFIKCLQTWHIPNNKLFCLCFRVSLVFYKWKLHPLSMEALE